MGSVLRRLHLGSLLLLASLVLGSFTLAVYLGLDPGIFSSFPPPFHDTSKPGTKTSAWPIEGEGWTRRTEHFNCSLGCTCEGWLYLPTQSAQPPPLILMASGMGAAKEMRLPHFAATFAQAGYGVLLFDYATWGGSTGEPRQLVRGTRHAQDYMAAGRHVQATNGFQGAVDPGRLVHWGSSYSGGHSLTAASLLNESYVKAVVAMEPYLSGRLGVRNFLFANACPVGRAEAYREGVATAAVAAAAAVQQAASAAGADLTGAPPPVLAGKEEEVHRGPFHRFLNKVQAIALRACASGGGSVVAVVRALRLAGAALLDLFLAYTGSGRAVYIPLVLSDVQLSTPSLCAPKHPHHQQQQDNTPPAAAPGSSVPDAVHHEWPWHSWANPLCYPVSLGRLPHNDAMAMFEAASHSPAWRNAVPARLLASFTGYHPLDHVRHLRCPVLLIAGKQDVTTPPRTIRKGGEYIKSVSGQSVKYVEMDGTHITLYHNPELLPAMLEFLRNTVPV